MTMAVLIPLRKQGDVSKLPAAPTAVLLQGSSAPPTATIPRTQGSSTSPTATLACTQGLGISLPDTLAHSYTPIVHLDPLLASKKGGSGPSCERVVARGKKGLANGLALSLSLPLASACNAYYEHIPVAQDNTSRIFPLVFYLVPTHLGWDTQRQIYSSVQGPPGSKRRQLARQVGACSVLTSNFPLSSRWGVFNDLFSSGRCSASGVSSSCPSTAATTWYPPPPPAARQQQRRPSALPTVANSTTSSSRGGRAASGSVPPPSSP
jgi:hypothetical protein